MYDIYSHDLKLSLEVMIIGFLVNTSILIKRFKFHVMESILRLLIKPSLDFLLTLIFGISKPNKLNTDWNYIKSEYQVSVPLAILNCLQPKVVNKIKTNLSFGMLRVAKVCMDHLTSKLSIKSCSLTMIIQKLLVFVRMSFRYWPLTKHIKRYRYFFKLFL